MSDNPHHHPAVLRSRVNVLTKMISENLEGDIERAEWAAKELAAAITEVAHEARVAETNALLAEVIRLYGSKTA